MILFAKDVLHHRCIVDTRTNNKSFIKMAKLLQRMGIKNNKFFLVLTQPELQGVDPHSTSLTEEIKLKIGLECKINPWYFFREVLRVPVPGGTSPFLLNRANLAVIWCFMNNINTYLTMPRQIGKTITALSITTYGIYIQGDNTNIGMFARNAGLRTENVRRVKELKNTLPPYLVLSGQQYNTDNQETVEYKPFKTKYITFVASADKKRAEQQGRGDSVIWTHWDEFAYYVNNSMSYDSAIAASETVGELAREVGLPAAHMITTTAGFTSSEAGKYAFEFKNSAMRFEERLYDVADNEELQKLMSVNSSGESNGYVYLEYSYKQLGKTDEWFKRVTANKQKETIEKDYLNRWIHGSGANVLPKDLMDKLNGSVEEPISVTIENSLILRWFCAQQVLETSDIKNIPFILAADTSDNVGKDFTTLVMLNPRDMSTVMTCRCNQTNMLLVGDLILSLMERFPKLLFIPERNRAATLIDILLHRIAKETSWNPFERIFNYFVQDTGDASTIKHDVTLGSVRRQFGYKTTGAANSRTLLYSKVLTTTIERNYMRIFDKNIIEEICGLVVRNGRVDHAVTGNDDTLIAYLIASWFIMYGNNIHLYGIDKNDILVLSAEEESDESESRALVERIAYITEKIKSSSTSFIMKKAFEAELLDLKPQAERCNISNEKIISIHQNNGAVGPVFSAREFSNDISGLFG